MPYTIAAPLQQAARALFIYLCIFSPLKIYANDTSLFQFNIDEPTLDSALFELAKQSGTSILGQAQATANQPAIRINGAMTVNEALNRLLDKTNIQYEFVEPDIIVLTQKSESDNTTKSIAISEPNTPEYLEEMHIIGPRISQYYTSEGFSNLILNHYDITDKQLSSIQDLRGIVPSIQFIDIADHNAAKLFIRGVSTFDYTEAGDQSIAHYRDGLYYPRTQSTTPLIFDVERIEVLRGPQGIQYGRGSIGGAINIYSKKPTENVEASGTFTLGSDNYLYSEIATNLPVTSSWSIRAAGALKNRDGNIAFANENPGLAEAAPYGTIDLASYRVSSLFKPKENFKWLLSFENFADKSAGTVPTHSGTNRVTYAQQAGQVDFNMDTIKTRIDYKIGNIAASYIGGGARFYRSQIWAPGLLDNLGDHVANTRWFTNNSYQHEVHIQNVTPGDSGFSWLVGLYYFKEQNSIRFDLQEPPEVAQANGELRSQISYIQPNRQAISKSAFAHIQFALNERTRVLMGMRYSHEEKFDIGGRSIFCINHYNHALPEIAASFNQRTNEPCWTGAYNDAIATWDGITGSARLEWDLTENNLLYLSYSSGWKPGNVIDGIDSNVSNGRLDLEANNQQSLQAERNYVIETGFNGSFLENDLHLNANLFFMHHKNMQASTYTGGNTSIFSGFYSRNNGAKSRVIGLELNANWAVDSNWYISSSISALNSRYTKLITNDLLFSDTSKYGQLAQHWNPCNVKLTDGSCEHGALNLYGNQLPFTPTLAAYFEVERTIPIHNAELIPSAQIYHQTKMFFTPENRRHRPAGAINPDDPGELYYHAQKAYTTLDLKLRYRPQRKRWQLDLFANNITATEIKQGVELEATRTENVYYWSNERSIGLKFSSNFM